METFKLEDHVRLNVRYSPEMIISAIDEEKQEAKCVWYDTKLRKTKTEFLPLNVLQHMPERTPIDKDKLFQAIGYKP
jgi:hypothetical protein